VRRRLPTVAWITLVWLALWGDLSVGNVLGGVLVAALVLAVVPLPAQESRHRLSLVASLRYLVVFLRDLTVATAQVARQVFWPVDRLRPAVVEVRLGSRDPGLLSLVANTITLTPGTMTLEVDPERGVLWVHALHLEDDDEAEKIVEDARGLERLGARALGVPVPDDDGGFR
jgi:multicomponent Na+:H+ antiporter subunit E